MGRSPQQDGGKHRKSTGNKTPFPNGLGQPALRALASAGYDHLEQLAGLPESEVRALHGIGPNALQKLRDALSTLGLSFTKSNSAAAAAFPATSPICGATTEDDKEPHVSRFSTRPRNPLIGPTTCGTNCSDNSPTRAIAIAPSPHRSCAIWRRVILRSECCGTFRRCSMLSTMNDSSRHAMLCRRCGRSAAWARSTKNCL